MTSYADPPYLTSVGDLSTDPAEQQVRLDIATEIVDEFCRRNFQPPTGPTTVTVSDVRTPIVPLPAPFTNVTQVTVDGRLIAPTGYIVETWGLRLYNVGADPDGFNVTYQAAGGRGNRYPYGAQVAVTATFGAPEVPLRVQRACALIALSFADEEPIDPRLLMLTVEGYARQFKDANGVMHTTGVAQADRLLRGLQRPLVG